MSEVVKPKHAGGRPSIYSREIVAEIVARMAEGETLIAICRDPQMPSTRAVREWAKDDRDGFQAVFQRARELQAHAVAEEVMQGARDATDPALGRLKMDAGKWFAAKLLPKTYSDRVSVDAQFSLSEENRTSEEIAASIASRQARLLMAPDDN